MRKVCPEYKNIIGVLESHFVKNPKTQHNFGLTKLNPVSVELETFHYDSVDKVSFLYVFT